LQGSQPLGLDNGLPLDQPAFVQAPHAPQAGGGDMPARPALVAARGIVLQQVQQLQSTASKVICSILFSILMKNSCID
jgi:hypothetical protein